MDLSAFKHVGDDSLFRNCVSELLLCTGLEVYIFLIFNFSCKNTRATRILKKKTSMGDFEYTIETDESGFILCPKR